MVLFCWLRTKRNASGVNPADILMERAYDLRDTNSAFRCASFQYVSYQKLTILPIKLSDSLQRLAEQPLFLSESVSEMRFKQPNKKSEKLVASKTSGLENPIFNLKNCFSSLSIGFYKIEDRFSGQPLYKFENRFSGYPRSAATNL